MQANSHENSGMISEKTQKPPTQLEFLCKLLYLYHILAVEIQKMFGELERNLEKT